MTFTHLSDAQADCTINHLDDKYCMFLINTHFKPWATNIVFYELIFHNNKTIKALCPTFENTVFALKRVLNNLQWGLNLSLQLYIFCFFFFNPLKESKKSKISLLYLTNKLPLCSNIIILLFNLSLCVCMHTWGVVLDVASLGRVQTQGPEQR